MKINPSKSAVIATAIGLPLLAVIVLMVAAGSGQVSEQPKHAKIHQVQVLPLSVEHSYEQQQIAYGRVEAANLANLGFELSGKVERMLVDEGASIAMGQVVAKLDTQRLNASMLELNAALLSAKADARLAAQSQQRVAELVARKLESSQRLDEVNEAMQTAQARVDETQARIETLKVELEKSELRAGFDGIVVARPVDEGTVVAAGQPVLVVQQNAAFDARIALSSKQADSLRVGQQYTLTSDGQSMPGVVKSIANVRQLQTRTIDVIFQLPQSAGQLLPGDLISLNYQKQVQETGVWVPTQALSGGIRGLWTLFTVAEKGLQAVTSRSVEVLYSGEAYSFVRGPLNEKDWMIISGTHRLVPGQTVDAIEADTTVSLLKQRAESQDTL